MNQNDEHDREVRDYVRNRTAADMPLEFTRDVMNDVRRTNQRGRGFAWPLFTGLATVAAAIAVVVIGLGLINQPEGVGSQPTPSVSESPEPTQSPTPDLPTDNPATPSPTLEPAPTDGEFGPIHSMAPDEAFENGESCEISGVVTTVGTEADLGWTISFPEGWHTNESTDDRSACTLFAPEPFEVGSPGGTYPDTVAIVGDVPPGGDFSTGNEILGSERYTVDGVAAVRYEVAASEGGFSPDPAIFWVIAIAGNLPGEGNDQPYLFIQTHSDDPAQLAEWADVLDRMVATLDIAD